MSWTAGENLYMVVWRFHRTNTMIRVGKKRTRLLSAGWKTHHAHSRLAELFVQEFTANLIIFSISKLFVIMCFCIICRITAQWLLYSSQFLYAYKWLFFLKQKIHYTFGTFQSFCVTSDIMRLFFSGTLQTCLWVNIWESILSVALQAYSQQHQQ